MTWRGAAYLQYEHEASSDGTQGCYLRTTSKGDTTGITVTAKESSRTDTTDWDWFPEYYPSSSFLFVLCIYSTERGFHTRIMMTT